MLAVKDTYQFCEQLVADTGIMLVPSRIFQFGDHHVRVGFGRKNLPEVITLFSEYLDNKYL
jgi:aspartate/methionine/tyrosine aminotransferase